MRNISILTICLLLTSAGSAYAGLAFVANLDGNWDLFTVDDDGRNLERLTSTEYDEKDPCWSSDGKRIVYATSDGHLNIIGCATRESHRIAGDEQDTAKISASFSPDDKEIAFAQFRPPEEGDDTDLKVFNLEAGTTRRVVDQYGIQMWPVWSPDASRIAYANVHCSGECGRLLQELWIADPDGGYARQLLMTNSLCQQPDWSADGSRIAFSSDKSGGFDIWVLSLKDWKLKQVTTDESLDVSPAWSSDGNRIAFVSTRSGRMEIWIKDLRSGELKVLRPFGEKVVECKDVDW